jgi:hypothetical protein
MVVLFLLIHFFGNVSSGGFGNKLAWQHAELFFKAFGKVGR